MKKIHIIILSIVLVFFAYIVTDALLIAFDTDTLKYNQSVSVESGRANADDSYVKNYQDYVLSKNQTFPQGKEIVVYGTDFSSATGDFEILNNYQGVDKSLLTKEAGSFEFEVDVEEAGFYHIKLRYFAYEGKGSAIERKFYLNDEVPFEAVEQVVFHRFYGAKDIVEQDFLGNDIRPSQEEKPIWTDAYLKDSIGYIDEPFYFYFEEGVNKIKLDSIREPLLIEKITVESIKSLPTYVEVKATYEQNGYQIANQPINFLQAETATRTTSPTIYPLNDRTSPKTMPSDPKLIKLNTIGGTNWGTAGDYITWEFDIEEAGLYEISLRVKQRLATGMSVFRNIYIDGEVPFAELENYSFVQSNDWRIQTLGTKGEAFLFYFEPGKHQLKMEVSLGVYGSVISDLQDVVNNLNKIYREILIFTGPSPDQYRDYELQINIPGLLDRFQEELDILKSLRQTLIDVSGSKSEKTGILDTAILQLQDFIKKPREIQKNLNTYVSNISSLGSLIILLSSQPLEIDYFMFHQPKAKLPATQAGFFESTWYSTRAFIATFTTNYAAVGRKDTGEVVETIEVWLSTGQDQANILRKLIDETFAPRTGIQVDLKLVAGSSLLPATLSGRGPDVALGQSNATPVNYAMRSATYDLSQFDDFDEIKTRFMAEAFVPYQFNGGTYALPEQQTFLMLFYRTDIFEEFGLTPPNTWQELTEMIPSLQKYNLEFYLPVPLTQGAAIALEPNPIFSTMFFQNDGQFYIDGDRQSGFNEGKGPEVFEQWTSFYTNYSFPVEANFVNRFRSGQMPIGIVNYNTYNTLAVFAPEIRGKWNFIPVPGTEYVDEFGQTQIRRETVASGSSSIILNQSDKKEEAWEFLKWWTSTETQVRFGREMEGILGAAARYPTANVEALSLLPWTLGELEKLQEQWSWVRGIPEVPGGYMTGRHLDNAFRMVYNESTNPRETIYDYVQMINEELAKKRREFGLE
ncbi:extracellular solute-binding protein [Acholeplasma hippikon]|uniref:Maltose-binding periplasmic proteins/domains n=1 Tax=Acholeplasma hippikon TaxID=264636 RepID=A0A449BK89_9MOLU|nr:extracellular solute-binding protein [Acholeplasma hippikon]VEU82813.1 Maltose-binding periplasmic proteins/domains [Acholeplasma hippikon]